MIDSGKYKMNQRQPAQANSKDVILFSRFLCGSYSDLIDSENSEVDFIMRYAKFAWLESNAQKYGCLTTSETEIPSLLKAFTTIELLTLFT